MSDKDGGRGGEDARMEVRGPEDERAWEGSQREFEAAVDRAIEESTSEAADRSLEPEDLPEALRPFHDRLVSATDAHRPAPQMPEGKKYPPADQVREIAEVLIEEMPQHAHLRTARIEYVYRGSLSRRGRQVLGKMTKCGAKWRELGGFDFLMEVNLEPYCFLSRAERIRLVDHELCHADLDEEGEFCARTHDLEEFIGIIDRWGTWHRKPAIRQIVEKGRQTELFETR